MLYWLSMGLKDVWGPFRLFGSHAVLLSLGTLLAGLVTWYFLPKLWNRLPTDRGKVLAADGGTKSVGKPTGAGLLITLILLPILLLVTPLNIWDAGVVVCLYAAMLFGYLDDASVVPWGELRKGLLDAVVALMMAAFFYFGHGGAIWLPFCKEVFDVPMFVYVPCAAALLWLTMNATNCSDGVDGLAGTLTLISLFSLAAFLYGVVGHSVVANYLLLPHNPMAARWAILVATCAGAVAGYLWHNAEPSRCMMGDAGSRFLGMLVGVAVLAAGNPFLIIVVSPVVLLNGGTGLFKLVLLRICKRFGCDIRTADAVPPDVAARRNLVMKTVLRVRFPFHDHCRKNLHWSNAQVLMRFVLFQAFLTPFLFVIFVKIR